MSTMISCDRDITATSLKIDEQVRVTIDSTIQINAVPTPSNAKINWRSRDVSVAMVDDNGCVTGVSRGETFVTAQSGELVELCKVIVREAAPRISIQCLAVSQSSATVSVKITDPNAYYVCRYVGKETADKYENDSLAVFMTESVMTELKTATAKSLKKAGKLFQGSQQLSAAGLKPSLDYVFVAVAIDPEDLVITAYDKIAVHTADVVPSENTFTVTLDSTRVVTVSETKMDTVMYFRITPSIDTDPYVIAAALKEDVAGDPAKFMEEERLYVDAMYQMYYGVANGYEITHAVKGAVTYGVTANGVVSGAEIELIVVGLNLGWTTDFFTYDFTYIPPKDNAPRRANSKLMPLCKRLALDEPLIRDVKAINVNSLTDR